MSLFTKLIDEINNNGADADTPIDLETDKDLLYDQNLEVSRDFGNSYETKDGIILRMIATGYHDDNDTSYLFKNCHGRRGLYFNLSPRSIAKSSTYPDCYSSSMYLRIKIPNRDNIDRILDNIRHMQLTVQMNQYDFIKIPSLTINLMILNKLKELGRDKTRGVNTFNLREWLQDKTPEEVKNYVYRNCKHAVFTVNRYFANSLDDLYLDIPLLFDFFNYGSSIAHNFTIVCSLEATYCDSLKGLVSEEMYIYPENDIYYDIAKHRQLVENVTNVFMSCYSSVHSACPNATIDTHGSTRMKFLYVAIESSEPDLDVTEFPEIELVTIILVDGSIHYLDNDMMYVADYDKKIRMYVISPDPEKDMRNWIESINEFKPDDLYCDTKSKGNIEEGVRILYHPMNVSRIIIKLTHWEPHVTVELHSVEQNCLIDNHVMYQNKRLSDQTKCNGDMTILRY
jgi:hypothetical protein